MLYDFPKVIPRSTDKLIVSREREPGGCSMDCQYHGFNQLNCPDCRRDLADIEKQAIKEGRALYGIFDWTGDNKYTLDRAFKTFKSKARAEKFVMDTEYVVRFFYI